MSEASSTVGTRPTRGAAQKARTNVCEQLRSSPEHSDCDDFSTAEPFGESPQKKGTIKVRYGGRPDSQKSSFARATPAKSSIIPIAPAARPRAKMIGTKRRLSSSEPSSSDPEELETLLGMPLPSRVVPSSTPPATSRTPRPSSSTAPRFIKPKSHSSPTITISRIKPPSIISGKPRSAAEDLDAQTPGSLVWVLVDKHGKAAGEAIEDSEEMMTMWWPGKIKDEVKAHLPLQVTLFGWIDHQAGVTVEVKAPSHGVIQPMYTRGGVPRFDSSDFLCRRPPDGVESSPRKKQKTNIVTRWEEAVAEMMRADEEENDGLPNVIAAYRDGALNTLAKEAVEKAKGKGNGHTKGKGSMTSMADEEAEMDRWTSPPCDDLLDIPGELVLGRSRGETFYYPAKILYYVPPRKPKEKPKYRLLFVDDCEHIVPRDWFYSSYDAAFSTCKIGQWESPQVSQTGATGDEEEFDEPEDDRAPSPLPSMPVTPDKFAGFSIHEQLAYVKPVLVAILNDTYGPAKDRHAAYVAGRDKRAALQKKAGSRGQMSEAEVSQLRWYLVRWALREERFARTMIDEEPTTGSSAQPTLSVETGALGEGTNGDHYSVGDKVAGAQECSPLSTTSSNADLSQFNALSSQPEAPPSSMATENSSREEHFLPAVQKCDQNGDKSTLVSSTTQNVTEEVPDSRLQATQDGQIPRQKGCATYETLSGSEKLGYCVDVLLPEAVIQILLWRSGDRTSLELLEFGEEKRLHGIGAIKAEERDWVDDVMRLRAATERTRKVTVTPQTGFLGGTRSRPSARKVLDYRR